MDINHQPPNYTYRHIVLEGTAYECGRQLGSHMRAFNAVEYAMYTELKPGQSSLTAEALQAFRRLNDRYCPGINDEMQGLADGLGIGMERLAANLIWHVQTGCCSHIAVLPGASADGHVLAARSYEWSTEDALCLTTTRVKGKFAHIGFSILACGRFDGINEKGLCITMSAGAPGMQPTGGGFVFWVGIRAVLDTCATVHEAVALITPMPSCSYDNIIICDRQGNAALIENACGHRAVRRIGAESTEQYIFSTNHFMPPGMAEHGNAPMRMSTARHSRIGQVLKNASPVISKESLRVLLTAPVPEGLSCHYYADWFGTLWSMVFDVTEGSVEVCFGSPMVNGWYKFDLNDPAGVTLYPAVLPNVPCTDPRFFSRSVS